MKWVPEFYGVTAPRHRAAEVEGLDDTNALPRHLKGEKK